MTQLGQLLSGLSAVSRIKEITSSFRFRRHRMNLLLYLSQLQRPESSGGERNHRTEDRKGKYVHHWSVVSWNSFTVKHRPLGATPDTHLSSLAEIKLMAQFDPVLKGQRKFK